MGIGTDKEDEIEIVLCDSNGQNTDAGSRTITKDELFEKYGNGSFDVGRDKPKKTFLMKYSGFMTKIARRPFIDNRQSCG